jgi:hypothetical protein
MKKKVLVFPCGSEVGLEIHRCLRNSKHFELYGASSVKDHGRFVYDFCTEVPHVSDPDFLEEIKFVCTVKKIDYILPAHDDALEALCDFPNVVTSPPETVRICRSKTSTYRHLPDLAPDYANDYPCFVKPDKGQGSKGAEIAYSREDVWRIRDKNNGDIVTREYLPGPEFTVDCFTDRFGKLRFCEGRSRDRIKNGISVETKRVERPEFRQFAENICERLTMRGAWFFQVKERANGELKLLEIAPRIAGSSGLWRAYGVNLVELSLWDAVEKDVDFIFQDIGATMSRALDCKIGFDYRVKSVYCDFDDCLLFEDNRINAPLYAYLLDCAKNGIYVCIVSRDAARYESLNMPFDIKRITDRSIGKSTVINPDGAIFIDDSFAERKEVHNTLGIPVFGLDAIGALLTTVSFPFIRERNTA